ncbi:MAG: hypothetical protein ACOVO2_21855 [Emticicia sp.]|uniref:hypothetical protein n=1 Tax=Emticicia sp. TaxID=1930953 RepID=UPI003BA5616A
MKQTGSKCVYTIALTTMMLVLFFSYSEASAQQHSAFLNVPETQIFKNKNASISVKNVKYTEYYKEFDCKWETSHAVISGLSDTTAQNYVNDWLSGMTFFGTCDGDHECLDIASFHYFYKMTYVTAVQNDLLGFFQKAGNCKTYETPCCETQDWEVYDLKQKRFLLESDIFKQDVVSQKLFFQIIEDKVAQRHLKLIPDWKAFDRQIGIENQTGGNTKIVVYLLEDVVGQPKGLKLEFSAQEISKTLTNEIVKRIF